MGCSWTQTGKAREGSQRNCTRNWWVDFGQLCFTILQRRLAPVRPVDNSNVVLSIYCIPSFLTSRFGCGRTRFEQWSRHHDCRCQWRGVSKPHVPIGKDCSQLRWPCECTCTNTAAPHDRRIWREVYGRFAKISRSLDMSGFSCVYSRPQHCLNLQFIPL